MGKGNERLYAVYNGMMSRCYNPNTQNYFRYGGRGITVCEEWKNSYEAFKEWAYESGYNPIAPRGETTLDRIDNDGNYTPDNCRWVNMKVQNNNQHKSYTFKERPEIPHKRKHVWTIDGVTKSGIEWCKEYGLTMQLVMYRIRKMNMTPEEALKTEKDPRGRGRLWYVTGIPESRSHHKRRNRKDA